MASPKLIAVCGASGSGKTTVATGLLNALKADQACLLSLDHYYRDLGHLTPMVRNQQNFDIPESIEHSLLCQNLHALKQGATVQIPQYDFTTHTRCQETHEQRPTNYIILEGIFALSYPTVRHQLDLSIFVQCPEAICLERRIERDVSERGRSRESVLKQYNETVLPAFKAQIEPQVIYADMVVSGTAPTQDTIARIMQRLGAIR